MTKTTYRMELPESLDNDFRAAADKLGVDYGEALRRALELYLVAHKTVKNGGEVTLKHDAKPEGLVKVLMGKPEE